MIKVLKSGLYTSIQDLGRFGFGNIGVPVSGAMDQFSSKLANYILGNQKNDAVLEITLGHCSFLFEKQTVICITGADCTATLNTKKVSTNTAIKVDRNTILTFNNPTYGVRSYLAVKDGFQTEITMQSRSYYDTITTVARINNGDILPILGLDSKHSNTFAAIKIKSDHFTSTLLQAYKGPEFDLLNQTQKEQLQQLLFTISNTHNRMGYRLEECIPNTLASILTSAVLPGTVQFTPSGKLIVLMRDCQVTGGYPRILQLTENAINQMAQKTTGDTFKFQINELF